MHTWLCVGFTLLTGLISATTVPTYNVTYPVTSSSCGNNQYGTGLFGYYDTTTSSPSSAQSIVYGLGMMCRPDNGPGNAKSAPKNLVGANKNGGWVDNNSPTMCPSTTVMGGISGFFTDQASPPTPACCNSLCVQQLKQQSPEYLLLYVDSIYCIDYTTATTGLWVPMITNGGTNTISGCTGSKFNYTCPPKVPFMYAFNALNDPNDNPNFVAAMVSISCFTNFTPAPTTPTTHTPSKHPTKKPTSKTPSASPTHRPSTHTPSKKPTRKPSSKAPSASPTRHPSTKFPSAKPTKRPTSKLPSKAPTTHPSSRAPSMSPVPNPTASPTRQPSTKVPSKTPSKKPTSKSPSKSPSRRPTSKTPSKAPSRKPTSRVPSLTPTRKPTSKTPSKAPTRKPSSKSPSQSPTRKPTSKSPSKSPTALPTSKTPSKSPTKLPTSNLPSASPSQIPTSKRPSHAPIINPTSKVPSRHPTRKPSSKLPSQHPTKLPTTVRPTSKVPSKQPTKLPSHSPTKQPHLGPTLSPVIAPTSKAPSVTPTKKPTSNAPTTLNPTSKSPSSSPTGLPTSKLPSKSPSVTPTSKAPSQHPTRLPTSQKPTVKPTSKAPSHAPTRRPTSKNPSPAPSKRPSSKSPSRAPTKLPSSKQPSQQPTRLPTSQQPSAMPTALPTTSIPSTSPSIKPTSQVPSAGPTLLPTSQLPTKSPTKKPISSSPTKLPTARPTSKSPTHFPTTLFPTKRPTLMPSLAPTQLPTSSQPSLTPTAQPTLLGIRYDDPFLVIVPYATYSYVNFTVFNDDAESPMMVSLQLCDGTGGNDVVTIVSNNGTVPPQGSLDFLLEFYGDPSQSQFNQITSPQALDTCMAVLMTGAVLEMNATIDTVITSPCHRGYYSDTGVNYPNGCELCPYGTYNALNSQTECSVCPDDLPFTALGALFEGSCTLCPLGHYCPVGSLPLNCPFSGGYEPLGYSFPSKRYATDCVAIPCAENYYCGTGAAQGSTYVKQLDFLPSLTTTITIKQTKSLSFQITNLGNTTVYLTSASDNPPWLSVLSTNLTILPKAAGTFAFTVDSSYFSLNASIAETIPFVWRTDPNASSIEQFPSSILLVGTIVTLVITPTNFLYSVEVPFRSTNGGVLSPLPQIDIFNTLCENDIVYQFRPTCQGVALPSWIYFTGNNPVLSPATIPSQQGLPDLVNFYFNFSDAAFQVVLANSSDSAKSITTCFEIDIVLVGLDVNVTSVVDVNVQVLQSCAPGFFSNVGNNIQGCSKCVYGYYQDKVGQTTCLKCPDNLPKTLIEGATAVTDCVSDIGSIMSGNNTLPCPQGVNCSEVGLTVQEMPLLPGYWRSSIDSLKVYQCPDPLYCRGGSFQHQVVVETNTNVSDLHEKSQVQYLYSPDSICSSNHSGVFCYACSPGFVKRFNTNICAFCSPADYEADIGRIGTNNNNNVAGIFAGLIAGLALGGCVIYYLPYRSFRQTTSHLSKRWEESKLNKIIKLFDYAVPLTIVTSYLQVVGGMSATFQNILPPFFVQLEQMYYVLALDFVNVIDFGCTLSSQNHYASLLISTILPLVLCGCLVVFHQVLVRTVARDNVELQEEFRNTTFTCTLVLLFLCYPPVSSQILSTLNCQTLDDGSTVLYIDPSISCQTSVYTSYLAYSVLMIFLYPIGIPAFYVYFLHKERHNLNPFEHPHQHGSFFSKIGAAVREKNKDIRYLGFLWKPYKPKFFWFEVFELFRKLFQTSIVVFISPGTTGQLIYQLTVTVVCVVIIGSIFPYAEPKNNFLASYCQWCIFGIALMSLMLRLQSFSLTGDVTYDTTALNVLMELTFLSAFVLAIAQILYHALIVGDGLALLFPFVDWDKFLARLPLSQKEEKHTISPLQRNFTRTPLATNGTTTTRTPLPYRTPKVKGQFHLDNDIYEREHTSHNREEEHYLERLEENQRDMANELNQKDAAIASIQNAYEEKVNENEYMALELEKTRVLLDDALSNNRRTSLHGGQVHGRRSQYAKGRHSMTLKSDDNKTPTTLRSRGTGVLSKLTFNPIFSREKQNATKGNSEEKEKQWEPTDEGNVFARLPGRTVVSFAETVNRRDDTFEVRRNNL